MTSYIPNIDLYTHIFELSSQSILVLNANKKILKANISAIGLFGYARNEFINNYINRYIPEITTNISVATIAQLSEVLIMKKDGSQSLVSLKAETVFLANKANTILFLEDKTDRPIYQWTAQEQKNDLSQTKRKERLGNWHLSFKNDKWYWSDEFYKTYTPPAVDNRLNTKTALNIIHPKDRESAIKAVKNTIKENTPYHIEKRIIPSNGKARQVLACGNADYNAQEHPYRTSGTIRDARNLKKKELALQKSNRRFTSVLEHIPGFMYRVKNDRKWTAKFMSEGCLKTTGYTSEEFMKEKVFYGDIILKEDQKYVWEGVQKSLQTRKPFDLQYRIKTKNGDIKYLRGRGKGIYTTQAEGLTIEGYVKDISARKAKEIELKEKQEQLNKFSKDLEKTVKTHTYELTNTVKKLVESNLSLEGQIRETIAAKKIADTDKSLSQAIAKNFPNGFIIVYNVVFEIILKEGEAIKELQLNRLISEGMPVDNISIFNEEEKKRLKNQISQTLKGKHLNFELEYRKRFFSVNTKPLLDEIGKITSALFVYNDITFQKKIEKDAQNALKKEQELNELKSRFIAMASHEFRTPLSAIQTSAILIEKQNESGKEEKRKKYVRQIKNNVRNLIIILNDFLSLSKLEEGKVVAKNERLDIIKFSKTIIEELVITKKKKQQIVFDVSQDSLFLELDPKLVRHILMNLLSNAIKYSAENSTIRVTINEHENKVTLAVKDDGIGIPVKEQHKLFERFFRACNASCFEGTGIGLNIVKQYVTLLGGSVEFESQLNKGSTFTVTFPK